MNPVLDVLLGLALGGALGGVIGWVMGWRSAAAAPPDHRLENELRQQIARRESELVQLRSQGAASNAACSFHLPPDTEGPAS